ncbi:myo-inositol 2-dehydrogenase [Arenibacter palladensis]|uniref:Myo-inositol 2-dehydrogenase n=1 Tax=Arenibacter palladensis TaxID=237373 RepID=A0A1M5CVE0_9FLAO|nr:inositol 2-dehydrogenase [Arenibacter palladensis]SHF58704.1 myo-inositol 2-dehydrogenase [Arenibacter palladensis]
MSKVKFAVAGLGRIGKIHLDNLLQMDHVEVVAVMDPMEECRKYAHERKIPHIVNTYEELLVVAPFDSVVICSPTDTHADYVEMAAKAGIHVFCEKPLDLSMQRVVEVLKVVKETNIKLMLGFNRRFDKEFRKVHNLVKEGAVGQPHLVKITSRDPGAPPVSYIKQSGGLFLDMTIHDFDMARFVVGKEVDEVYAKGAVLVDPAIGEAGDIDTAVVTLTYTDGTMAVIDNSREAAYGYDQRLEVFGSKGMAQADNNYEDSHRLYTNKGILGSLPLHFFLERYAAAYRSEMASYVASLKNGDAMAVDGTDGLRSLQIGLAAIKSLKEKRPVKIAEIGN